MARWNNRQLAVASLAGLFAAVAVVAVPLLRSEPSGATDGSFVLEEPGIYAEPTATGEESLNPESAGETLPDVEYLDADGDPTDMDRYVGEPLVINIWFSRCAPCARELADFAAVDAAVGDRVNFLGVNPFDTPSTMVEFAAERGVEYELARDEERELPRALGILEYPVTLFVDPSGTIVRQTGELTEDELRVAIDEVFGISS